MTRVADEYRALLFVDFDGVLHPTHNAGQDNFCRLPLLESVLREHPAVGVVISSSWRHHYAFDELCRYFADDIRARIVGMTRSVEESGARNRHDEIADYLRVSWERRPYVVLDDSRFEFPRGWPHVVFCDSKVGFDAAVAAELAVRLRRLVG